MNHSSGKERIDFSDAVPFKIDGHPCKLIHLTKGLFAIVDAGVHKELTRYNWYALRTTGNFYAVRRTPRNGGQGGTALMHAEILGCALPLRADHINGVGLHNWKTNLRPSTHTQNMANMKRFRNNTSGFKGVSRSTGRHKNCPWRAYITVNGKHVFLGYRATAEECARLYDEAAIRIRGEFASLNFPRKAIGMLVPKYDPLEIAVCICGCDLFSHRKHTACVECDCREFVEKQPSAS